MSKEELLELFATDKNGIIISNKYEGVRNAFVGQPLYVAWYWLNYEPVSGWEDEEDENGDITLRFEVLSEDAEEFPELEKYVGETLAIKQETEYKISELKEGESS